MHPESLAKVDADKGAASPAPTAQWSLAFHGRSGRLLDATLAEGTWVIGSGEWADVIVPVPGVLPEHLRLEINAAGLVARRYQPALGTDTTPALSLAPGDSGCLQLGPVKLDVCLAEIVAEGPAGATGFAPDGPGEQSARLPNASAAAILQSTAESPLAAAIELSARRVRLMLIALVGLMAAAALAAAAILPEDVRATNSPVATLADRRAALAPLLKAHKLDHIVHIDTPEGDATPSALIGQLPTPDACERYRHFRSAAGAMHFMDRVACLPDLQASVDEYLAGLGITVKATGGRLLLEGSPSDPGARTKVEAAISGLSGLVAVESAVSFASPASGLDGPAMRQLRARIVAAHAGDPGYVVLKSGDYVYEGGVIAAGVELVSVEPEAVHVRMAGSRVEIQL